LSELTDLGAAVNVWSAFAQAAQVHGAKRLLVADAVSKAGDWMLFVAVSAILYQGGGAAALAIYSVARLVVPVAAGPWSGRVGAGLPPRLVMIASDLARAALLVVAAAAATWSAPVWLVLVPVVGCTLLAAWFNPAEKRFQRDAVPADQRPAFYAVIGATGSTAMIFAPACPAAGSDGSPPVSASEHSSAWFSAVRSLGGAGSLQVCSASSRWAWHWVSSG
jgi:MFS family permease